MLIPLSLAVFLFPIQLAWWGGRALGNKKYGAGIGFSAIAFIISLFVQVYWPRFPKVIMPIITVALIVISRMIAKAANDAGEGSINNPVEREHDIRDNFSKNEW